MKAQLKTILILALVFVQFAQAQSPWTRQKGKAYVQLGFSGIFYDKLESKGKTVDLPHDVTDITSQVYGEYGITDKLEAQLILPFKIVGYKGKTNNFSESLSGIGNVNLGLKYKIFDGNWKISAGLQYAFNSITKDNVKDLSTGFNAETALPYITFGTSSGKWYYFGNVGYGYMSNTYSDFFKFSAEVGYSVTEKSHLIFVLDTKNIVSKEEAFNTDSYQWASYLDRQSYSAVGLKFNYEFSKDKFGLNFAALGAFDLDNAPAAPSFNFGLYSKF
ncbi:hypothetical protein [Flavobacterium sp.]|uniref:hypothetical protein n=1 Tax=Flavobacterium sp. TaxID=239 RepID=UPI0037511B9A